MDTPSFNEDPSNLNPHMLPNFFVIGAQKAGTTSLHHYLREHPDIYLPPNKETKFFIREDRYAAGIEQYQAQHFSQWNGEGAVGEIDPDIIFFPEALERIENHFDIRKLKFILLLRQPVDRAFSHYLMSLRRGFENESFERAVALESGRMSNKFFHRMHFSYTSRGFYYAQIARLLMRIDPNRLLVRFSDELKNNTNRVLTEISTFLEIDPARLPKSEYREYHKAKIPKSRLFAAALGGNSLVKQTFKTIFPFKNVRATFRTKLLEWNSKNNDDQLLNADLRQRMFTMFEEDVSKVERLLGVNLDKWK